jgi:hypothetical protein
MANLTLRKANAIQATILEYMSTHEVKPTVSVNEFAPVQDQIDKARLAFSDYVKVRSDLNIILYGIRAEVSKTNSDCGIDAVLTKMAQMEKQMAFTKTIVAMGCQTPIEVLEGKVAKLKSQKEGEYYGRGSDISTTVISEAELAELKSTVALYAKEKAKLQDKLLSLNIETKIQLDKKIAEFLVSLNIL